MSLLKYMADMVLCILTAQLFKPEFRPMRTLLVSNWETQEAHWPAPDRFYPQRLYVVKDKVSICVWIYLWAFCLVPLVYISVLCQYHTDKTFFLFLFFFDNKSPSRILSWIYINQWFIFYDFWVFLKIKITLAYNII